MTCLKDMTIEEFRKHLKPLWWVYSDYNFEKNKMEYGIKKLSFNKWWENVICVLRDHKYYFTTLEEAELKLKEKK
jgi:hypothetical protein